MYYGKDKSRQMGRSILPSARRKGAREDLAAVKRKNRTNIRQALKKVDPFDPDDFEGDLNYYPDEEINYIRRDRRSADKLAHFERWAEKITTHLPVEDRLGYMRAKLPPGLIGDHAMSHLEGREHFLTEEEHRARFPWRYWEGASGSTLFSGVEDRLRWIISEGHHRAFNRRLRPTWISGHEVTRWDYDYDRRIHRRIHVGWQNCEHCEFRPLYGLHDIDDFVAHYKAHAGRHSRSGMIRDSDWLDIVWYAY